MPAASPRISAPAAAPAGPALCARCGYDLAGLAPEAVCPECAYPVEKSLHGLPLLRFAEIDWLQRTHTGLRLLVASAWTGLGAIVLFFVGLAIELFSGQRVSMTWLMMGGLFAGALAAGVMHTVGCVLASGSTRGDEFPGPRARAAVRYAGAMFMPLGAYMLLDVAQIWGTPAWAVVAQRAVFDAAVLGYFLGLSSLLAQLESRTAAWSAESARRASNRFKNVIAASGVMVAIVWVLGISGRVPLYGGSPVWALLVWVFMVDAVSRAARAVGAELAVATALADAVTAPASAPPAPPPPDNPPPPTG